MSVLDATSISVRRGGCQILSNVSISLASGEFLAIIGPNGSGKSSLLRALAGIWPAEAGSVSLDGMPIGDLSRRDLARRVAFVPQDTRVDFAFTVEEIVSMGRHPHRGRFTSERESDRRAINLALERCDVSSLRHRLVNTLSGGERQRVLIARSLAVEPAFLLLDEPTANLDIQHALEILGLCRSLADNGQAIAFASHDINAVSRYASSVALVNGGRIVAAGARHQVLTPQTVQDVFGVVAEVLAASNGQSLYLFHRRNSQI
jgi:iron complex transport system ATP-binding protein